MSYVVTLECGCEVYVSCHPRTGLAHTRVIERRAVACRVRSHAVGTHLALWELLPPRDPADETFTAAVRRAKTEFLEMPGLKLTLAQAQRLWAFDRTLCNAVLAALVEARFLVQSGNASFIRAD
jgi:hypothetical protein